MSDNGVEQLLTLEHVAEEIGMTLAWTTTMAEVGSAPALRLSHRRRSYRVRVSDLPLWHELAETVRAIIGGGLDRWIYFVQPEHGGPVKIGIAENVAGRFDNLQSCSPVPLRLLAVFPGDTDVEAELHERFAAGRVHGEWFTWDTPGLPELILEKQQEYGTPMGRKVAWRKAIA